MLDHTLEKMFRARAEAAIAVFHPELARPQAAKVAPEPMHPIARRLNTLINTVLWLGLLIGFLGIPTQPVMLGAIALDSALRLAQLLGLLPTGFYGARAWKRLALRLALYAVVMLVSYQTWIIILLAVLSAPLWIRLFDPLLLAVVQGREAWRLRHGMLSQLPPGYLERFLEERRREIGVPSGS